MALVRLSAEAEDILSGLGDNAGRGGQHLKAIAERSIRLLEQLSCTFGSRSTRQQWSLPPEVTTSICSLAESKHQRLALQAAFGLMRRAASFMEAADGGDACPICTTDLQSSGSLLRWVKAHDQPWGVTIKDAARDMVGALKDACNDKAEAPDSSADNLEETLKETFAPAKEEAPPPKGKFQDEEVGSRQGTEEWDEHAEDSLQGSRGYQTASELATTGELDSLREDGEDDQVEGRLAGNGAAPEGGSASPEGSHRSSEAAGQASMQRTLQDPFAMQRNQQDPFAKKTFVPYRADVPLVPARPMLKRAPSAILPGSPDVKKARRPVAPEHHPKQVQPLVGKPKPGPHVKALHRPAAAAMKKGSGVKKASPSPREGRFSEDHVPCVSCGTRNTPQWRRGPDGELNMCNACGVRLRKGTLRRK